MKILFLSRWYPDPPDNGARQRVYHLLRALASAHTVDLISFSEDTRDVDQASPLRDFCRRVETAAYTPFQPVQIGALLGLFSRRPRSFAATFSPELSALAARAAQAECYDAIIASEIDMAPYALRLPAGAHILEELEIGQYLDRIAGAASRATALRHWLTWWKLRAALREMLPAFDACTVASEKEAGLLRGAVPGYDRVAVIPNGVDLERPTPDVRPRPDTLIYAGALTYAANYDAVAYFSAEILPRIRAERPAARLTVTGALDGVDLSPFPPGGGVELSGYLPDVAEAVAASWLSVVPLRAGGGTRLKVLESLGLGTPVVATRKGAEGLDLRPGRDLLLADEPAEFAAAALSVLGDAGLRAALAAAGRERVANLYAWPAIGHRLLDLVEEAAANRRAAQLAPAASLMQS